MITIKGNKGIIQCSQCGLEEIFLLTGYPIKIVISAMFTGCRDGSNMGNFCSTKCMSEYAREIYKLNEEKSVESHD